MNCLQARRLFDAYLDRELSSTMMAELDAHRLRCADCRRALALLEVSEHVLSRDEDPVELRAGFSDRLIACMEEPRFHWSERLGRFFYLGVPIAAAALIALAFLGIFDTRRSGEVAGNRVIADAAVLSKDSSAKPASSFDVGRQNEAPLVDEWFGQVQTNLQAKRRSVESIQTILDHTLLQPLSALEEAKKNSDDQPLPDSETLDPEPTDDAEPDSPSSEDVEDL